MSKKYTFTMVVVKPTGKGGKPLKPKEIKPKNKSTGGSIEKVPGGYSKEGSGRISDKGLKGRSPQQVFAEKEKRMENTKPQGMTKKMGGGMMKKYNKGGQMLKGGQKKLDKNKDGKISGEDFKMMRAKKGAMVTGKKEEDDVSKYVKSIKLPDAKDVRDVVNKKSKGGKMIHKKSLGGLLSGLAEKVFGKKASASRMPNVPGKMAFENGKLPIARLYQKATEQQVAKKSMGGEMKKGYGAARQSGMGLQDENLIPGKSMDYYKDLM